MQAVGNRLPDHLSKAEFRPKLKNPVAVAGCAVSTNCASDVAEIGRAESSCRTRGIRKLRCICNAERFSAKLKIVTFAEADHFEKGSIEIEKSGSGEKIAPGVPEYSISRGRRETPDTEPGTIWPHALKYLDWRNLVDGLSTARRIQIVRARDQRHGQAGHHRQNAIQTPVA